jgi:hypothetical protein
MTPKDAAAAGLPKKDAAGIARYRLCREKDDICKNRSVAIGAGTDGKDVGADVDAIQKEMDDIR